uniref:HAT C-terminal dimerisation domain-containing protein n=1 Tax=Globodera rostochiensis TaxID=31243 RepID=A0A914GUX1_GLORO
MADLRNALANLRNAHNGAFTKRPLMANLRNAHGGSFYETTQHALTVATFAPQALEPQDGTPDWRIFLAPTGKADDRKEMPFQHKIEWYSNERNVFGSMDRRRKRKIKACPLQSLITTNAVLPLITVTNIDHLRATFASRRLVHKIRNDMAKKLTILSNSSSTIVSTSNKVLKKRATDIKIASRKLNNVAYNLAPGSIVPINQNTVEIDEKIYITKCVDIKMPKAQKVPWAIRAIRCCENMPCLRNTIFAEVLGRAVRKFDNELYECRKNAAAKVNELMQEAARERLEFRQEVARERLENDELSEEVARERLEKKELQRSNAEKDTKIEQLRIQQRETQNHMNIEVNCSGHGMESNVVIQQRTCKCRCHCARGGRPALSSERQNGQKMTPAFRNSLKACGSASLKKMFKNGANANIKMPQFKFNRLKIRCPVPLDGSKIIGQPFDSNPSKQSESGC